MKTCLLCTTIWAAALTGSATARAADRPAHAALLALEPRIEAHARFGLRLILCPTKREDQVAEIIALAWL